MNISPRLIDGRLEVAFEKRHHFARGGAFEVFTGLLGHYQLSGEQDIIVGTSIFAIQDPSVESYAGFLGVGGHSRIGFNWGIGGRAQVSYSSNDTAAIGGYLRVLGVF